MADILKITTPLINKNQQVAPKPAATPASPFQLQDLNKVLKPYNQRDITQQYNTLLNEADSPEILLDLLKDPGVTVTYLKNIFMLEEIIKLLPQNNAALTKEIENLFQSLMLPHTEIASELYRQEQEATVFRGEFFDFLRQLVNENRSRPDLQNSVLSLMRSINNITIREDVIDAVANSLTFLAKSLAPSVSLSKRLETLAQRFRRNEAPAEFEALKGEALSALKDVEGSLLFDPKLQKMSSITTYNLSRFNNSMEYFHDAAGGLWQKLGGEQRALFGKYVSSLMDFFKASEEARAVRQGDNDGGGAISEPDIAAGMGATGATVGHGLMGSMERGLMGAEERGPVDREESGAADRLSDTLAAGQPVGQGTRSERRASNEVPGRPADELVSDSGRAANRGSSKVMDSLIEMIKRQSDAEDAGKAEAGQVDKILHSLLSSPCNFTPLLHFVVPSYKDDVKAFAEIWINPYDDENGAMGVGAGRNIHILMVLDVEILGRFEVELKIRDRIIDLSLHCPPAHKDKFADMLAGLPERLRRLDTRYRFGALGVEVTDHSRSLMEVFKTLPYKRMGMDIRV